MADAKTFSFPTVVFSLNPSPARRWTGARRPCSLRRGAKGAHFLDHTAFDHLVDEVGDEGLQDVDVGVDPQEAHLVLRPELACWVVDYSLDKRAGDHRELAAGGDVGNGGSEEVVGAEVPSLWASATVVHMGSR